MVGESLAVDISVEGRPTPSVQWSLNGIIIENTTTRTVSSTGLVISAIAVEDAGEYVVTGTNDVISTSVCFMVILNRKWPNRAILTVSQKAQSVSVDSSLFLQLYLYSLRTYVCVCIYVCVVSHSMVLLCT